MPSIVIFITHFGAWPAWIDFFVEFRKKNSDINWVLLSDSGPLPRNNAQNIKIVPLTLPQSTLGSLAKRFEYASAPRIAYKIADIRPAFGEIHADMVRGYDFFGYGDLDVIYGRIRDFYTNDILARYSVLSTHPERLCGHFALLRNIRPLRRAFRRIPSWTTLMEEEQPVGIDENRAFFLTGLNGVRTSIPGRLRRLRFLLEERYSSPGPTHEMRWYWKNGILMNEFYGERGFLYLHFMHWKSSRWYRNRANVTPGAPAPWETLPDICPGGLAPGCHRWVHDQSERYSGNRL